jgi:hypothetical protein
MSGLRMSLPATGCQLNASTDRRTPRFMNRESEGEFWWPAGFSGEYFSSHDSRVTFGVSARDERRRGVIDRASRRRFGLCCSGRKVTTRSCRTASRDLLTSVAPIMRRAKLTGTTVAGVDDAVEELSMAHLRSEGSGARSRRAPAAFRFEPGSHSIRKGIQQRLHRFSL